MAKGAEPFCRRIGMNRKEEEMAIGWHPPHLSFEKRPTSHRDSDPRAPKFLEKAEKLLPEARPQIPQKKLEKY